MVSLAKGQTISLEKTAGRTLTRVVMGLGWDARQPTGFFNKMFGGSRDIDLDASCVLFDAAGNNIDTVWFRQLRSRDGSIVHTGDNRTGQGEGDDEQIQVDLSKVPPAVKTMMFVVSSWTGETFAEIENAFCRLVDADTNKEVARYTLSGSGQHTAQLMAKVFRDGEGWNMQAIGAPGHGRSFQDLMPMMQASL